MALPLMHERPDSPDQLPGIVTPEAVLLQFAVAGLASRALAFCLDLLIRLAVLYALVIGLALVGGAVDQTFAIVIVLGIGLAFIFGYPIACETFLAGRSPGKMALGLRVVTIEGAPVRFRHAAIRAALSALDFMTGFGSIAILAVLVTRQSQRLGDLAAGTIVIRERQADARSDAIAFQPPPGWEPYTAGLDVSRLDERHYVLVRAFLLRVQHLGADARAVRGRELAGLVGARIGVEPPYPHIPEAFLVSAAAAYQGFGDRRPPPPTAALPTPTTSADPVWESEPLSPTWGTGPARP